MRNDAVLVTRNRRAWRRLVAYTLTVMVGGILALAGHSSDWFPLHLVSGAVLGAVVALAALQRWTRAHAYRNGWLDGRLAMVATLHEAHARRMTFAQWLESEKRRDEATAVWSIND